MRTIKAIKPRPNWKLEVEFEDGVKIFDVGQLLGQEAFADLFDIKKFKAIRNCGYYVEWRSGADLSADTLYAEGILKSELK